ncbi:MAG: nucS [Microbacterium sp.]|nr:nucS [Microbacterium sp.]
MRLVIARCSVDYTGRLNAHLPLATRLLVHKGDGSLLVHSDGGSYKPLNWMSPPCRLVQEDPEPLVRREFPTAIGPVDLLLRDPEGGTIAVEVKRRGDIDGVEQLTRYLELLGRDPHLAPVKGVFAAQEIKPQARVLATDRGIRCVTLDYEGMKGIESGAPRLF